MKIAIPDLISNSYFPVIAAVDLGFFAEQGLDVELELMVPVETAFEGMRNGTVDFLGASAHLMMGVYPNWHGVKILCAQSQGMYWFLVTHKKLGLGRGGIAGLKNLRIGAAPWVAPGLRRLLHALGHDAESHGIEIMPIPGAHSAGINFGVTAARALEEGRVDGFWANGMGAELAIRRGIGDLIIDARRDDVAAPGFYYTMPVVAATEAFCQRNPSAAKAAVLAMRRTHEALKQDVSLAAQIGRKRFPPEEAELIVELVRRDLPFYDTAVSPEFVESMLGFSRATGLIDEELAYGDVVLPIS
jgi:ABC-type nitrate/sulfonate/bicarbonate transport system substrate-binding protein